MLDVGLLKTWVGRQEQMADTVTATPVMALSATLDRDDPIPVMGDVLPPLWHWLYFLPVTRSSLMGPDGHPKKGGFLPPVPLPRRMWAGGRLLFHRDIHLGETISRTSQIIDVSVKHGRSGPLVFVLVRHEIAGPLGLAITEEHDIVYRDAPDADETPQPGRNAPQESVWSRNINPDPVLLFRYSALTFNSHRIHYDRDYATQTESYPGLIVHGPLIATLLADLVRQNTHRRMSGFRFRALRPLFDTAPFSVHAGDANALDRTPVWARDPDGFTAMQAEADLEPERA